MMGYTRRFPLSPRSRRLPVAQVLTVMVSAVILLLLMLDGAGAARDEALRYLVTAVAN